MEYPDVSADLERFIEEGKEQYNLLANDFEKRVVVKVLAAIKMIIKISFRSSPTSLKGIPKQNLKIS